LKRTSPKKTLTKRRRLTKKLFCFWIQLTLDKIHCCSWPRSLQQSTQCVSGD
jgi:hypothetical protein